MVDSASRSDAGMYRVSFCFHPSRLYLKYANFQVVAENDYGSARTTCEVTVQRKHFIPYNFRALSRASIYVCAESILLYPWFDTFLFQ